MPHDLGNEAQSISIVVLSYNRKGLLRENLQRLKQLSAAPHEIIVVDNSSSDGSQDMVREQFPEVRLFAENSNLGVARGRNRGFRESRGEVVVYLDDDSLAPIDICEKTMELFRRYPKAGCLAYQICHDGVSWFTCEEGTKVGNYYGGAHAFRLAALKAINYLDEGMWFGGEEIDSSLRLYKAGYEVIAATSVRIENRGELQSAEVSVRRHMDWFANFFGFYVKFFPYPLASLFVARMTASYVGLCVRKRTLKPLIGGLGRAFRRLPETVRSRDVVPPELARFYADPNVVPIHYNASVAKKLVRKLLG
jgi:glycosyltransferase involved in cell wall biosynthesis